MGNVPIFDRTRSIFANNSVYRGNFFILFSDMNSLVQDGFNGIHITQCCFQKVVKLARESTVIWVFLDVSDVRS